MGDKFEVSASTACDKIHTVGNDGNLFGLVPVREHGFRVLPLELVPVSGRGAQISARAPAKGMFRLIRGLTYTYYLICF